MNIRENLRRHRPTTAKEEKKGTKIGTSDKEQSPPRFQSWLNRETHMQAFIQCTLSDHGSPRPAKVFPSSSLLVADCGGDLEGSTSCCCSPWAC